MGRFEVRCTDCNSVIESKKTFAYHCKNDTALGRSHYETKILECKDRPGLWRYYDWLPVKRTNSYNGKSITFKSSVLAKELGLNNLYISFNGYWPEKNAFLKTCTFKELEAAVTIQYAKERGIKRLGIASAGNTARSFAYVAGREGIPIVLIIPWRCLWILEHDSSSLIKNDVWLPKFNDEFIKTLVIKDGDYSDAIILNNKLAGKYGITNEGGVRNIARRDGLSTVLLDAVQVMGEIPDHYFQAIGTGTGAISVWEGVMRLIKSGGYDKKMPQMHLSQNLPFAPMVKAWDAGRRKIDPEKDMPLTTNVLDLIEARVLSNRYPPYGCKGGVYDLLEATKGNVYGIRNNEIKSSLKLFENLEGIDIHPASAVAVASLKKAVNSGKVLADDKILLNITGGGEKRLKEDMPLAELKVDKFISKDIEISDLKEILD